MLWDCADAKLLYNVSTKPDIVRFLFRLWSVKGGCFGTDLKLIQLWATSEGFVLAPRYWFEDNLEYYVLRDIDLRWISTFRHTSEEETSSGTFKWRSFNNKPRDNLCAKLSVELIDASVVSIRKPRLSRMSRTSRILENIYRREDSYSTSSSFTLPSYMN